MLRDANAADVDAIAALHVAGAHAAYADILPAAALARINLAARTAHWQRWFAAGGHRVLVADKGGSVQGFVRTCPARPLLDPPQGWGEISHLYVAPERLGSGLGHALFTAAQETLRDAGHAGVLLWTLQDNRVGRAFYERHGMRVDGTLYEDRDWHGPGILEVRYRLPFDG